MSAARIVSMISLIGIVFLGTGGASGQSYPTKPIRIVTSAAGGVGDLTARLIAEGISGPLGQAVVVENRPSNIGPEVVFKAPADGYTLLQGGATFLTGPLVNKTPYDPVKDFVPISLLTRSPYLLAVHPSLPAKSVKELVALAKSRPGEINVVSSAVGGSNHLAAAQFASLAGVKLVHIPYKGSSQAMPELLSGAVHMTFESGLLIMPYVKSGKLRALAVTTIQPSTQYPQLPTVASAGLTGYDAAGRNGMWAPANTAAAIVTRLNEEIARLLKRPEVKERLLTTGSEAVGSSPEELTAVMKSEIIQATKVLKSAGVQIQ